MKKSKALVDLAEALAKRDANAARAEDDLKKPFYKGAALKNQKPEPTFSVLLTNFETLVREHQSERLDEYKRELKKDLDKLRVKILEAFHRARFEARK